MKESLGGRPRAVQGKGRHERSSVEIHRLVMISEHLSAIQSRRGGELNQGWRFSSTATGSWYFLDFSFARIFGSHELAK